nr:hypothetical protein [Streptobacillus moniliformis]
MLENPDANNRTIIIQDKLDNEIETDLKYCNFEAAGFNLIICSKATSKLTIICSFAKLTFPIGK